MASHLYFRRQALHTLLDGRSVLDSKRLSVRTHEEAEDFIKSYGYDWSEDEDRRILLSYYRQAMAFFHDQYISEDMVLPKELDVDLEEVDLRQLLLNASGREDQPLRTWSCGILKVMHIIAHLNNDLYSIFHQDIRQQILQPIREKVFSDSSQGSTYLQSEDEEKIRLQKFEVKPVKNQTSAIIKLLAKKRLVALNILDRVGVRLVTRSTFDIFRVMRFLVNQGIVSYPHCIVNESANRVYPVNIFLETMDALRSSSPMADVAEIDLALERKYDDNIDTMEFRNKDNVFTDPNYRFIKFISRKLVKVRWGDSEGGAFRFFYPFEVQIMDYQTHLKNMRGPLSHDQYKARQKESATLRLFGHS